MKRRDFLRLSAGTLLASQLPKPLFADKVGRKIEAPTSLNIRKIEIPVGIKKPFAALHISDTHLTKVDDRDVERKIMLAASRARWFSKAEHYLDEAIHYARANKLMLIHTGDLIDFVSEANLDAAAMHYRDNDWFVSAGNHEYSLFVGEAKEDEAYKKQSYDKVQENYPNDLTFYSQVVNGVNFVSIDDVYYNVTERQHELVANEMKRGLPVVLLCHVPFYTPKHCQYELKRNNGSCGYLTGAPLEITSKYATDTSLPEEEQWRNRSVQQRADKATLDFIAWLKEQPLLKGILCGHMHYFYEERFSKTAMQYTVGATYNGDAYLVRFK